MADIKWDHTPLDERLSKLNSGIVVLSQISLEEFQRSGSKVISLEENVITFSDSTSLLEEDIVVSGITDATPAGFLGRIGRGRCAEA